MSYQDEHIFYCFPVEGGRFEGCGVADEDQIDGPVFPYFLEADFSSYERFLKFADEFGLEGFACYSEELRLELDTWLKTTQDDPPRPPISREFLTAIWEQIKEPVLKEQALVRSFFEFQQKLHRCDEILVANPNVRCGVNGGIKYVQGLPYDLMIESLDGFNHIAKILKEMVRPSLELDQRQILSTMSSSVMGFEQIIDGQPPMETAKVSAEQIKDAIKIRWDYDSIPARCYSEIAWLIRDGKTVKLCGCCHKPFVPKRFNERYCDRLYLDKRARAQYKKLLHSDPAELTEEAKELMRVGAGPDGVTKRAFGADDAWTAEIDLAKANDPEYQRKKDVVRLARKAIKKQQRKARAFRDSHTCKEIGRQITFKTENEQYLRDYKRVWAQVKTARIRHGEDSPQYKKASATLAELKEKKAADRKPRSRKDQ